MQQDKNIKPKMPHSITVDSRKKMYISGVLDIDSFNEQSVVALTDMGVLIIKGNDLHINKLSVESGDVSIEGSVDSVSYTEIGDKKTGSILKSLFK